MAIRAWSVGAVTGFMLFAVSVGISLAEEGSLDLGEVTARTLVVALDEAVIATEIPGRIDTIMFRPGESFKEGDVLVSFDCSSLNAQRDVGAAQVRAENARRDVQKRLFDLKSIGALEFELAEAELERAEAQLKLYQVDVDRCTIQAPYNGRIVEWAARPKEYVTPGTKIIEIVRTGSLELNVIVPSTWKRWLSPGLEFMVHIEETGTSHPAKVRDMGSVIDSVSQTLPIFAVFVKNPPTLIPGMSGTAVFSPQ